MDIGGVRAEGESSHFRNGVERQGAIKVEEKKPRSYNMI